MIQVNVKTIRYIFLVHWIEKQSKRLRAVALLGQQILTNYRMISRFVTRHR